MFLKKIKDPILFQGNLNKNNYFEGWYYKQISKDESKILILIPGISLFKNDPHSFLQYLFVNRDIDGKFEMYNGYVRYPAQDFKYKNNPFIINIGDNSFSKSEINLNLCNDKININGNIKLHSFEEIKKSILTPNIMGCFAYIPNMECYHGIMSMNHKIDGQLKINEHVVNFNDGKGYIEKDWGTSFPKEYIWVQCNSFENANTSLFLSIAHIPFMKKAFKGYICNLVLDHKEYRFATYNKSKIKIKKVNHKEIEVLIENNKAILRIETSIKEACDFIAPQNGNMKGIVKEGILGNIKICLYDKRKHDTYLDESNLSSIEIMNF
ncbi:hypothetical protein IAI10_12400 [Clostridium sp. 19966]|uniref:tocopherol cyclase family protein n=1 Tax=Clostridium sp. 19966 TaxID=2768166 RepID=UPI0028DF8003|nr:tocopherol cyclase family protein [Clostridium sp. 19966]MDT8717463.1 hypothetical protein [Clostridium sp. 19966]